MTYSTSTQLSNWRLRVLLMGHKIHTFSIYYSLFTFGENTHNITMSFANCEICWWSQWWSSYVSRPVDISSEALLLSNGPIATGVRPFKLRVFWKNSFIYSFLNQDTFYKSLKRCECITNWNWLQPAQY